jgi:hypothetical protein
MGVCYDQVVMFTLVFDASALISAARFEVLGVPILDHILSCSHLLIPRAVKIEVVDAGLKRGYPDALLLQERINSSEIGVIETQSAAGAFQTVLDDYGIEVGDKDLLLACRQFSDYDFVVVDDRLLYIILNRFDMRPRFLPDVPVWLARQGCWSEELAGKVLNAIRSRYRSGFITHSLEQLKGNL